MSIMFCPITKFEANAKIPFNMYRPHWHPFLQQVMEQNVVILVNFATAVSYNRKFMLKLIQGSGFTFVNLDSRQDEDLDDRNGSSGFGILGIYL